MDEATTPWRFAISGSIDDLSKVQVDDFGGRSQANAARKDRDAAANVDDFSSMPDADQPATQSQNDWKKFRQASFTVNKGIISVPPGTKTTASWPKNPNR